MEFKTLLTILPEGALKNEIQRLLNKKRDGEEVDVKPKITLINEYLEKEISHFAEYVTTLSPSQGEERIFDEVFREILYKISE